MSDAARASGNFPSKSAARLRAVDVVGPLGRLEALWNEGAPDAKYAALVCHPHPLGGGTMHNKVVYHAMKVLNEPEWGLHWPVLRFNFRGTGLSAGTHHGEQESDDVLAALDWLKRETGKPIFIVGFSFGAVMALRACTVVSDYVQAIAALGLPIEAEGRSYHYAFLDSSSIPKLFLSGSKDQYADAAALAQLAATIPNTRLRFVQGADHFFTGQLRAMQTELSAWLKEQI